LDVGHACWNIKAGEKVEKRTINAIGFDPVTHFRSKARGFRMSSVFRACATPGSAKIATVKGAHPIQPRKQTNKSELTPIKSKFAHGKRTHLIPQGKGGPLAVSFLHFSNN
jgi:hypothetical protein